MSRRDELIEQMALSLREKGLGSSTMESILEDSGVTAGSMYHYFPNGKEELAATAVQAAGATGAELLRTIVESEGVVGGTVVFYEALVADMETSDFRYGCPVGVPSTESAAIESVRSAGEGAFALWIGVIAEALEREGVSRERAIKTARFAIAAYEGASTLARTLRDTGVILDTLETVKAVLTEAIDKE